jgi:hypothetical protein
MAVILGVSIMITGSSQSCLQHAGAVPMYPDARAAFYSRLGFCLLTLRAVALQHAAQGRQIP